MGKEKEVSALAILQNMNMKQFNERRKIGKYFKTFWSKDVSKINEGRLTMLKKSLFSVLVLALLATALQAQEFVADGLVLMYTLDSRDIAGDVVKDVSGNGNDAKIMGTLSSATGVINECLKFAAGGNYVEIPAIGSFEKVSLECWAYEEEFAAIQGIISTWQWAAGKVHFKFESNQIQVDKNGAGKIIAPCEAKKWYHIIYTTDTVGDSLKLYVDGELASEGPGGAGVAELWDERRIGSEHDGRFLNGMIDEVRLYNRVLSAAEVKTNYQAKSNVLASVEPSSKASTTWADIKK